MKSTYKRSIIKTLNRQNKMVKDKIKRHTPATFIAIIKKANSVSFAFVRKTVSKHIKGWKKPTTNNMDVLKSLGYVPKTTKVRKTQLRLVKRNCLAEDGWTCKERRLILRMQRKLQNAA